MQSLISVLASDVHKMCNKLVVTKYQLVYMKRSQSRLNYEYRALTALCKYMPTQQIKNSHLSIFYEQALVPTPHVDL